MTLSLTFVAFQKLRASQLQSMVTEINTIDTTFNLKTYAAAVDATSRTTTSATYTETLSAAGLEGVVFVVGSSGAVRVEWRGEMSNSSNGFNFMSINIRTGGVIGSGTVTVAADDNYAARSDTISATARPENYGQFYIATGLTVGNTYNASISQRCQTGTLTVNRRAISVSQILV